jgi:hypothetical protein
MLEEVLTAAAHAPGTFLLLARRGAIPSLRADGCVPPGPARVHVARALPGICCDRTRARPDAHRRNHLGVWTPESPRNSTSSPGKADGLDVEPGMVRGAAAVSRGIEVSHQRCCRLFLEQAHACVLVASLQSSGPPRSGDAGAVGACPGNLRSGVVCCRLG